MLLIYKYIIINIYKLYFILKKYKRQLLPAEKVKLAYIFINKYIAHIVIIILTIIISFSNLFTTESKAEGFGENSILYALATGNNPEESYTEEAIIPGKTPAPSVPETTSGAVAGSKQGATNQQQNIEENKSLVLGNEGSALIKPEINPMQANQEYRDELTTYVVREGDTVGSIAEDFDVSEQTIMWANNLNKYSIIRPGQTLQILPINGISYKVVKGDNLAKIATKFKANISKIIEFNKLADQSDINVGDVLIIPEGQPYYPPIQPTQLGSFRQIFQEPAAEPLGEGKMLWPNGCRRITQYFSWHHTGVDIACQAGTSIKAADDGKVFLVEYKNTGYGHSVRIDHGAGKTTVYGHMTTIFVTVGETVKRGQVIGLEGSTGHSTGPHLHFEVRFNGKVYNPLNYIR